MNASRELLTKLGFALDRKGLDEAQKAVGNTMSEIKKHSSVLQDLSAGFGKFMAIATNPLTIGVAMVGGVAAMTAFAEKTAEANHELYLLTLKTGMTMDQLAGIKKTAAGLGVPFETLNMSLGRMTYNIRQNAKQFKQFGIDAKDPAQTFEQVAAAMEKTSDPAMRAKIGMLAFGRQWQEMVPLLAEGAEGIHKALTSTHLDPKILENYEKIHKGNIQIKMAWGAIRKALGDIVSGPLATYTQHLAKSAKEMAAWVSSISKQAIEGLRKLDEELEASGFYNAIREIQALWGQFVQSIRDATGAGADLKDILEAVVDFATNIVWTFALMAFGVLKVWEAIRKLIPTLHEVLNLIKAAGIYMAIIYGVPMLTRIGLYIAMLAQQVFWQVALNLQLLIANIRMAAQGGILNILSVGWSLLTGGIFKGVGAMRMFGVASMTTLGAVGAAIAALYWAYTRIMDALEERSQRIQQEQYDAARGQIEDELKVRDDALKDAKAKGDAKEIAAAQKHYDALSKTYRKEWVDKKDRPGDKPEGTGMDIEANIKTLDQNMAVTMQKEVQSGAKNTTINNKMDFSVQVPAGAEQGTGLTPGQVNTVASNAAHSMLSMTMMEMVNGTL